MNHLGGSAVEWGKPAGTTLTGRFWIACALVFIVSLVVLCCLTAFLGAATKFTPGSDPDQYLSIGRSLAAGNGYKNLVGPWPNLPDCGRMPGWPAIQAVVLWVARGASPEAVSRYLNAVCLSMAGMFFCALTQILGVRPILGILAGLTISLSPSLVYLSVGGLSEVSFVMLLAIGMTCVIAGSRWVYLGAFVFGLGPLIRTNFILAVPLFLGLALLFRTARRALLAHRNPIRVAVVCFLAIMPSLLWAIRNYAITGRFPLLSTIEGETLYGANNEMVANNLEYWGYWVMPDVIPGEIPKMELVRRLGSDLALSDYYHRQGIAWIRGNVLSLPRLEVGKFVRAFVPVPWVPLPASYIAFGCRFLLYVLWAVTARYWWRGINRTYLLMCVAMAIVNVVTVAIYYGTFRFTHCVVEILFVPCIMFGLQQWWGERKGCNPSVPPHSQSESNLLLT